MTLRTKFVLLLAAFSAFLVGNVGSAAWAIGLYLNASFTQFTAASDLIEEVDRLRNDVLRDLRAAATSRPPPEACLAPGRGNVITGLVFELDAVSDPEDEPTLGRRLVAMRAELARAYARLRDAIQADPPIEAARLAQMEADAADDARHALAEIKSRLSRRVQAAAANADNVQRNVLTILVANAVVAVMLAVFGSVMVQRWVTRPIQALRDASVRFAEGDLRHRVPIRSHDELGLLSAQINDMAHRLAESRRRLVERERMAAVGELCSAVAHGIRNPLSAIATSAELVLMHGTVDARTRARLQDVLDESERLSQRVTRLLDFARSTEVVEQTVHVGELLDQAAGEMEVSLTQRGVRLEKRFADADVVVRGDREMLVNAVIELITNAAEQPSDDAVVILGYAETDEGVEIRVCDHGPGFSERALPRVFDLFFTTKAAGNGIGLASVRKAVELHGGRVRIRNQTGGGACVALVLPPTRRARESDRPSWNTVAPSRSPRLTRD